MPAKLEHSAVAPGLERSVFIPIPKKGNAKEWSNYHTIPLISHGSKLMFRILQARLQQYMNRELPDVQAGFRKAEEPEIKLPTSTGSKKKARELQKNFCFIDYTKALDYVDYNKVWKILIFHRDGNTIPPELSADKSVCRSSRNS